LKQGRFAIPQKTVSLSESVIREMTRLADEHSALNLAQGFPDFPTPKELKFAAMQAIKEDYNQYAVTWGAPRLRKAISEKAKRFNGIPSDPDANVTVTCGSTEAMFATILALADRGDEVIVMEPVYENYLPATTLAGARPRPVKLHAGDFRIDEEALKRAFNSKTKLLIVNTPHNPTGKVFDRKVLKLVADVCEDHDTIAVTDEIYEHILYDGREHVSLASLGDMSDRTVTISGISKTYSATGWRVGYAIAPRDLTNALRKVHDFMTVCAPAPLQEAAAVALGLSDSYYEKLAEDYSQKRDFMVRGLSDLGFRFAVPEGAYYILADFHELSEASDTEFAVKMVKDGGVATVPGSSFYSRKSDGINQVRFSYSKKMSTLRQAVDRMRRFFG
jgi:aminotransferase